MRFPSRLGTLLVLNMALILFSFNLFSSVRAQETVSGVLSVIYEDNREAPTILYRLYTNDGQVIALDVSEPVMASAGGITALMGARVSVALEGDGSRLSPDVLYPVQSINIEMLRADAESAQRTIAGAQTWVNLMCKFSGDASEPYTSAQATGFFANSAPFLDHYYRQNSFNLVSISTVTTTAWATLPRTRAQYLALGSNRLNTLFDECAALHTGTVTFNNFYGINMFFNNQFDGSYWGSSCVFRTLQGTQKCWRNTWLPYYGSYDINAYAHEMGHAYGLPHSNNSDGDSNPYDNTYDVMSGFSCEIYNSTYGCQQPNTIAPHKDMLEWIPPARFFNLTTNGTFPITLDRLAKPTSTNTYSVLIPISASREIYIEARRNDFGTYDNTLIHSGVVIHDVNSGRTEPAWQVNAVSDGASIEGPGVFEVGETFTDFVNGYSMTVNSQTADGYAITLYKGALGNSPDLNVSVLSSTVSPGKAQITIRVRNNGTGTATNAFLGIDSSNNRYVNTVTGTPDCYQVDAWFLSSYLCDLGNLAPGAQVDIPLDLRPSVMGTLNFPVAGVSNEAETNASNNTVTVSTGSVTALPDMNVTITPSASTANLNQNVTYTYLVRDLGGVDGNSIQVGAALPAGMTLQSFGWNISGYFSGPACAQAGNGVNCTITSLGPNYEADTRFVLTITAKAVANGSHVVTGTVSSSGADATPADNTASVTTHVGLATINATVGFMGRPAAPNALLILPLDVTVTPSAGGAPVFNGTVTTNNNGRFTLNGLAAGSYNIRVKGDHTLSIVAPATIVVGSNNISIGTLKEGDANDDNVVTITDFSILASSFGLTTGQAGFDDRADFNGDGLVTITDFSMLASNFGLAGQ